MLSREECGLMSIAGILREMDLCTTLSRACETMTWLPPPESQPIWSRRMKDPEPRRKWYHFDVEVKERLWSLWGRLPRLPARSPQILACCVVACCAASVFRSIGEWSPRFLDAIIVDGDAYHRSNRQAAARAGGEMSSRAEDLLPRCGFQGISFQVQLQPVTSGQLYCAPASKTMSLYEALNYFFTRHQIGIVACAQQYLAFGYSSSRNGGYFLYDCSGRDRPLFLDGMGVCYVLRSKQLMMLLYSIVVTLNVREASVDFLLYSAEATRD